MPLAKLNTPADTNSAPPRASSHPVRGSFRRNRVITSNATRLTAAKPSSQPAWSPSPVCSSRKAPVGPPNIVPLSPPPGPPDCPATRPSPLYPKISDQTLLSDVPEIHGRSADGVSVTTSGHASPTAAIAAPPVSSRRVLFHNDPRALHNQANAIGGTTSRAPPILVSNPSPTSAPLRTIHRARSLSRPRTAAHTAATQQSTSSSSGLL